MQLKMSDYQLPEKILFNYDELKQELLEKVSMYETLVYTDEQIKDAKADKAALNKLKKALNDERIRLEKEYMRPFNEFKGKINEIIAIIDKPAGAPVRRRSPMLPQAQIPLHDPSPSEAGSPESTWAGRRSPHLSP